MEPLSFLFLFLALLHCIQAEYTSKPARPPAFPLAVKSPYLSTWKSVGVRSDGSNGGYLAEAWPGFWSDKTIGWAGLIRVDGTAYSWLGGVGITPVNQTSYEYTSTRSIFTMTVEQAVEMTITFLSPITPDDLMRQSLVFSYLHVDVKSLDGAYHNVQLYADISGEWVSGDLNSTIQWDYGVVGNVAFHKVYRQTQLLFSEINDQAEWGNWYWATDKVANLTFQSGRDTLVRGAFIENGTLPNTQDSNYRAIQDQWPVFGFAVDLGAVGKSGRDTLFSIGLAQEQAIQFEGKNGLVSVPSLWTSYFPNDVAAVEFFQGDFQHSSRLSMDLDSKIAQDATAAAGQDYLTITSLTVRQAFGAIQLCGSSNGTIYLFMKEISSSGNVNTVDVVFPSHPIFIYSNSTYLKFLLDPLFENQEAGHYPYTWSMHDLGSHYPNATGHSDGGDERMPLEECGNMVIMTLAYYKATRDLKYLQDHYPILKTWTQYLVSDSLYPSNQISTDDFAGPLANQTDLALKGIIGIGAMSAIAFLTGNIADEQNYVTIAKQYLDTWLNLGIDHSASYPHTTLAYGQNSTHGLLYNIYSDAELGLDLIPQSVYDMQSAFYPTVKATYGVPLDTRHNYTKGDWECFAAAVASKTTQQMLFNSLAAWINQTTTNRALTDLYDAYTGGYPVGLTFAARPVMGASFALLALQALNH